MRETTRTKVKKEQPAAKTLRLALALFIAACVVLPLVTVPPIAQADDVYTWTDEEGRVHFSTKPESGNATKAELPALRKEDLDQKIKTIKDTTPPNCEKHGGEDCSRGPDSDGSVICLDGYRGAILPFRFHCVEARLETEVKVLFRDEAVPEKVNADTLKKARRRPISALHITVRNLSGVEARGMQVSAVVSHLRTRELPADGPVKVEPFGLADYTVPLDKEPRPLNIQELKTLRGRAKCVNCR